MTVHSGKFGVVDGQSTMRNWQINDTAATQKYVASNTRGGSGRQPGVRDWNGSFGLYGVVPTVLPGDAFNFQGYTAPSDDVGGNAGVIWQGDAIVDQVALTWNWESGEILSSTLNFSADGELTDTSGLLTDLTDPDVPIPCGTKITYGVGDTEWPDLVTATLTITAANQTYVNSSSVINGECWTRRRPGVIDWTLAVTEHNDEGLPAAVAINASEEFKLWVDDTEFWYLKWGKVGEATGLQTDREGGTIIRRTVNIAMDGFNPSVGEITLPGAISSWWPFTG